MPGRRQKSAKVHDINGNPGRRQHAADVVFPPLENNTPPDWLSAAAKRLWRQLVPELRRQGIITKMDVSAMAMACEHYACFRRAEEALADGELVTKTSKGALVANPLERMARAHSILAVKFLREFGLTPDSRHRIAGLAVGDGQVDDVEAAKVREMFGDAK